ncbi:cupin domain-containing protein [Pseudonocardia adelaidensis]|uniref:Cupin type-2 domain-containing protein n=1 Tax=Pseudonocardia adelaidensis TaxID=648754 RepID=A0ABP9NFX5_9PSEU
MRAAGHVVHFRDVEPERTGGVATHRVHADVDGSGLELVVVVVEPGHAARRRVEGGRDELLYVLSGGGTLVVGNAADELVPDTGALVGGPAAYAVRAGGAPLVVVVVAGGTDSGRECGEAVRTVCVADQDREAAVSDRQFRILFDPGRGCSGMTQFVGYVPQVRTPRHYHPYDEMLCIVRGSGTVEIEGKEAAVGPGDCYYLPRGCVHLVQNSEEELLVELGVFTPAGSPAQNTPVE